MYIVVKMRKGAEYELGDDSPVPKFLDVGKVLGRGSERFSFRRFMSEWGLPVVAGTIAYAAVYMGGLTVLYGINQGLSPDKWLSSFMSPAQFNSTLAVGSVLLLLPAGAALAGGALLGSKIGHSLFSR